MNVRHPHRHFGLVVFVGLLTVSFSGCNSEDRASVTASADRQGMPVAGRDGVGAFRAMATVTIDHPDRNSFSYVVVCEGNVSQLQGVAEIDADSGCAALADAAVQQRLIDGSSPDRICTQVYGGPDTAVISGNLDGTIFNATIDRTDGCGISDWDELLGDLLVDVKGE